MGKPIVVFRNLAIMPKGSNKVKYLAILSYNLTSVCCCFKCLLKVSNGSPSLALNVVCTVNNPKRLFNVYNISTFQALKGTGLTPHHTDR